MAAQPPQRHRSIFRVGPERDFPSLTVAWVGINALTATQGPFARVARGQRSWAIRSRRLSRIRSERNGGEALMGPDWAADPSRPWSAIRDLHSATCVA